jgi:hypothetical protein
MGDALHTEADRGQSVTAVTLLRRCEAEATGTYPGAVLQYRWGFIRSRSD